MVMYLGHVVELGDHRAGLLAALSPLYRGAAVGGADCRHQGREAAYRAGGRHSLGDEPAAGLPVPDALPLEGKKVPGNLCETEVPPVRMLDATATRSSATSRPAMTGSDVEARKTKA
jgi:hypothetical protein